MGNAMAPINQQITTITAKAKQYCHDRGIESIEDFDRVCALIAKREFEREIEPLLKTKVDVFARRSRHNMKAVIAGGTITIEPDELNPDEVALFAQIDEMIAATATRYGLEQGDLR